MIVASGGVEEEILLRMEAEGLRSRVWWLGNPFMPGRLLELIACALGD